MLRRTDGGWVVDVLAGSVVAQLRFDFAVGLVLRAECAAFELRIEGPFTLCRGSQRWPLQPDGNPANLAPMLMIQRDSVAEARVRDDGRMILRFGSGVNLEVAPGTEYEAWELVGPSSFRVVSMPGGSLAIWQADEPPAPDPR